MNKSEGKIFFKVLNGVLAASKFGKPLDDDVFGIWWGLLGDKTLEEVRGALEAHMRLSGDAPYPHDIISMLNAKLGYMGAEEAWNRLPKDESSGSYVNDQMMVAWGACSDSLERGDLVAARMAFIEVYSKAIAKAKLHGERAKYHYSAPTGLDYEQKLVVKRLATIEAVELGWLDKSSESVMEVLEYSPESVIKLEDLSNKCAKELGDSEKKQSALSDIRKKLGVIK